MAAVPPMLRNELQGHANALQVRRRLQGYASDNQHPEAARKEQSELGVQTMNKWHFFQAQGRSGCGVETTGFLAGGTR